MQMMQNPASKSQGPPESKLPQTTSLMPSVLLGNMAHTAEQPGLTEEPVSILCPIQY